MILYTDQLQRADSDYPIVASTDVKGGLWTVDTAEELNQIPSYKLQEGMLAYVTSLELYFQCVNQHWQKASFNASGIPIYTQQMYDSLSTKPEDYLLIRDPENEVVQQSTYIDVLFQSIRKLQAEVAKLKNSFRYGLNSYIETNTAMSQTLGQLSDNQEQEPLWALEEDDLSEFTPGTINMDYSHRLTGADIVADNEAGVLHITGDAYFNDPDNGFKESKDPKSIVFLTTSNLNVTLTMKFANDEFTTTLNRLVNHTLKYYNILIVVSKKTTKKNTESPELYGKNYLWIQITDPLTNVVLKSGYYNGQDLVSNLYELDNQYYIQTVKFTDLDLSKFNSYVKAQDFSNEVIPSIPQEQDYKFGVAHITIRSIASQETLDSVKTQLQNNELVWVEDKRNLCIVSKGKIYTIGGTNNNNDDNTMTQEELIAELYNLGIITIQNPDYTNTEGGEPYNKYIINLANLSGVTFIHNDTGKKFDVVVDSEGNLRSSEVNEDYLLNILKQYDAVKKEGNVNILNSDKLQTASNNKNRGFISTLRFLEGGDSTKDAGLKSDRLKIGAIYAPDPDISVYGCSHAYIELENTSDRDINLKGCVLSVSYRGAQNVELLHLKLTGVIKAGGTYLIRGKKYANFDDANTIIKVKTFDQEWYTSKNTLIDLQRQALAILLTYQLEDNITLTTGQQFVGTVSGVRTIENNFIDVAYIREYTSSDDKPKWAESFIINTEVQKGRDYIVKNTFELDPAKQAFQSLHEKDSSRLRGANKNDFKYFYIDKPIIEFPNSEPTYDVSLLTPKASFEGKNVSTDKTKLNKDKPNMVYCSFGIDMHKTKCFNWVSVGNFDEYIWVRPKGSTNWEKFESYKGDSGEDVKSVFKRKNPGYVIGNQWSAENLDNSVPLEPYVYKRMHGRFPGDGSFYTAHKCMLELNNYVTTATKYEYIVGRQLINGDPDTQHTSEIQEFTIYPQGTTPKVYHITDQQGFYWVEYQTWAGAAKAMSKKIEAEIASENIMPVIINTGDVTQNGTRINEWLDYYLAGYDLFKQFEHMSVVGNNDLCGTDPAILGTGDDVGKSNGYYHHLFNCFEIQDNLLVKVESDNTYKYIPSTYYFESVKNNAGIRFVNVDSELTYVNCHDWFGTGCTVDDKDLTYNLYTGWAVSNSTDDYSTKYYSGTNFIPLYNTLYKWFNTGSNVKCIASCHEIPFTVMTLENLAPKGSAILQKPQQQDITRSRSLDSNSGSLVGSHMNQLTKYDKTCLNWFSRLLEDKKVKLVLGGHKHTYTCTFPVREFYFYGDNKNSFTDGPQAMSETLENDNVTWDYVTGSIDSIKNNTTTNDKGLEVNFTVNGGDTFIANGLEINSSRLPIIQFDNTFEAKRYTGNEEGYYTTDDLKNYYLPGISDKKEENAYKYTGIVYFMCQATGYKQTSNKELPGYAQVFSKVLPKTSFTYNSKTSKYESKANNAQKYPMFGEVTFSEGKYTLYLSRIIDIQNGATALYLDSYSTASPSYEYLNIEGSRFGSWSSNKTSIMQKSL